LALPLTPKKATSPLDTISLTVDVIRASLPDLSPTTIFGWYGTLKNLKPEGFMKVRLPNGEKYDGVWLNGQMQRAFSIRNRRNAEPVYHFH
jgi:hypothetical protein